MAELKMLRYNGASVFSQSKLRGVPYAPRVTGQ